MKLEIRERDRRAIFLLVAAAALFGIIAFGCAVLNTALNFWLIPSWGPMGAALATFLTWLAYMAACWVTAMKEHHIPYPTSAFLKLFLVACVIYWLGRQVPSGQLLISLLIKTVLMAVFLATVLLGRYSLRRRSAAARTGSDMRRAVRRCRHRRISCTLLPITR